MLVDAIAYSFSMSDQYDRISLCAEIPVKERKSDVIRDREDELSSSDTSALTNEMYHLEVKTKNIS